MASHPALRSQPGATSYPLARLKGWRDRLKVSHKIGWGYAIALGSVVGGMVLGIEVGDYYLWQAWQLEDHAQQEIELLRSLQADLLQVQTHQQQLIAFLDQPDRFRQEYADLQTYAHSVEQSWTKVHAFTHTKYSQGQVEQEVMPEFLHMYDEAWATYNQQLQRLMQQINPGTLQSPTGIAAAQASLRTLINSSSALALVEVADGLDPLIERALEDHQEAIAAYHAADLLRLKIVSGSILLSVAIGIFLALYTSRVIVRPLQSVTKVAQQATQESNFELQAPVTTADEIGGLATSLNQLIQRVKHLLAAQNDANAQLEAYSRTLEQKVQERTQALADANAQLEAYSRALEQKVQERTQALNQQNVYLQQTLQELQQTQMQMIQSEKMSSLGQMVAGVAHEINNPVSFIHGNIKHASHYIQDLMELVQLYQQQYPQPGGEIELAIATIDLNFLNTDLPRLINSMQVGADRIREIVTSLRTFSRSNEAEIKAIDLHQGIDSTLMILHHRLKAQPDRAAIEVVRDYGQLPLVECFSGQLNQVFMNVLSNAIDALEEQLESSAVGAGTALLESHPPIIQIQTQLEAADQVTIRIRDNGCGIPAAVQSRLFDPFFTTKPVGKGTGLGLSISYQIVVEKHNGKMLCHSTPAQGTEFVIQIPVQQSAST